MRASGLIICKSFRLTAKLNDSEDIEGRVQNIAPTVTINPMVEIKVETVIAAPIEKVFDLARSLKTHTQTTGKTNERIISPTDKDLLELGDEVTFEAKHLGVRQRLTSKIVQFDRPNSFSDQMVKGAFRSLRHYHQFEQLPDGQTKMTDTLTFESPLGPIGKIFDHLFLRAYMTRFIQSKSQTLNSIA